MDSKMLLTCALDIGKKMLISGAEISRVEDSVKESAMHTTLKELMSSP